MGRLSPVYHSLGFERRAVISHGGCAAWLRGRSVRRRNRDDLDLDKLAWVAKDSYAEQCARHVVTGEETCYLIPGGDQVTTIAAGDVDGRLQHIRDDRPDSSRAIRRFCRACRIWALTSPRATTCPCSSSGQAPAEKIRTPWAAAVAA
jgi:hypothetical protein